MIKLLILIIVHTKMDSYSSILIKIINKFDLVEVDIVHSMFDTL